MAVKTSSPPYRLVLLRHGQSTWNQENLFTGWVDVPLSEKGLQEATHAGTLLKREPDFLPDLVFTSLLRRSINTANAALDAAGRHWIPVVRAWELNERHYGGLQGKNKASAAQKFGDEQVHIWRRSFDIRPPESESASGRSQSAEADGESGLVDDADGRYARSGVVVPQTECLKDVLERVQPYWEKVIVPEIRSGKTILIAAHGNSLRALMKMLEGISDEEIPSLEIPTGVPIVYDLDEDLKPIQGKGRSLE